MCVCVCVYVGQREDYLLVFGSAVVKQVIGAHGFEQLKTQTENDLRGEKSKEEKRREEM